MATMHLPAWCSHSPHAGLCERALCRRATSGELALRQRLMHVTRPKRTVRMEAGRAPAGAPSRRRRSAVKARYRF